MDNPAIRFLLPSVVLMVTYFKLPDWKSGNQAFAFIGPGGTIYIITMTS